MDVRAGVNSVKSPEQTVVLVADDKPENLLLMRKYLEPQGYRLVEAKDGDEALLMVAQEEPDIAILDVMMPGRDGFEVCQKLKSWDQTKHIPVLLVTAMQDPWAKVKGSEVGADEFLTKPVDDTELLTRVRSLLNTKFYREELLKRNALLERILNRYLSAEVINQILATPEALQLGGERKQVSVLFADLRGFTNFVEGAQPEVVMETLNSIFNDLTKVVFEHRGTLDKFIGDCLMAFFGAPVSSPEDARNAVVAAVEMRQAFAELLTCWKDPRLRALGLGIGINTGEAIVGNVGSERIMDYTVIGDVVNLASRLEKLAKPGQILLGESTYTLLESDIVARKLPDVQLKGRTAPVNAYELVRVFSRSRG